MILAFRNNGIKDTSTNRILFGVLVITTIFYVVVTRDGSRLPDYGGYVEMFYNPDSRAVEGSFKVIVDIAKHFTTSSLGMFAIYAMISVTIRYYAIYKYSPIILYSLAVWIASFLLLHEMIQIRGAVASALLLLIIPSVYQKKYIKAVILILISFWFHRASLAFILLLFMSPDKGRWKIWISAYAFLLILNLSGIGLFQFLSLDKYIVGFQILEGDIYDISSTSEQLSMFAPYILLQTVTCFVCIYNIEKLQANYPYSIMAIKTCLFGVLIYSLPLGVVSLRLAELFSTAFIFVYPLLIYCVKTKYKQFAKIGVSFICLAILTNFIFLKGFII